MQVTINHVRLPLALLVACLAAGSMAQWAARELLDTAPAPAYVCASWTRGGVTVADVTNCPRLGEA